MKLKLMLISIKQFESKSGDTKYKYVFLSPLGKVYTGFSDLLLHEDKVVDSETFDSSRAHEWNVDRDVYNEKLTYRVQVDQ